MKEKKSLIVIEDEFNLRYLLTELFIDKGIPREQVISAADGAEALRLLKKYDVKVISLDIKMPGMDGIEFLYNFDKAQHNKVVIFSAYVDHRLNEYPKVKFILNKPEDHSKFFDTVLELANA